MPIARCRLRDADCALPIVCVAHRMSPTACCCCLGPRHLTRCPPCVSQTELMLALPRADSYEPRAPELVALTLPSSAFSCLDVPAAAPPTRLLLHRPVSRARRADADASPPPSVCPPLLMPRSHAPLPCLARFVVACRTALTALCIDSRLGHSRSRCAASRQSRDRRAAAPSCASRRRAWPPACH